MTSGQTGGWLARFRDLPNESPPKMLAVALGVALVCAVLVSTTAVILKPLQEANKEGERQARILEIVRGLPGIGARVGDAEVEQVDALVVELGTGQIAEFLDATAYDQRAAAQDPDRSIALAPEDDPARIGRRADYATVYLVRRDGAIRLVILPVHGSGYASTLYGYLALEGDGNTVVAISFYEHGETPGLGARIEDPEWRALWAGKKLRDEEGNLRIAVAGGPVAPGLPAAAFQVDGISGATRTGEGISNLLRFWLGDKGFGPFLERVRTGGV